MNKINKILLVYAINHNHNDYRKIQMLGISYLQSALHKEGFDCDCYDGNIGTLTEDELVKYIIDKAYDFIGFSILFSNTKLSLRIAESIKKINPKVVVAFGGTNATVMHKELIDNYPFIDVVMRGAGEETIVSLIKDYNNHGKFLTLLKSCSYQNINNKSIYATEIAEIENLDSLVYPNREHAFEYSYTIIGKEKYHNIDISTSRGCPYQCVFCSVPMFRLKWKSRSAKNVLSEIQQIYNKKHNIYIIFIDDNFLINVDRALEITKGIYYMGLKDCVRIPFVFATRADQLLRLSKETLLKFKQYGCYSIEIGIENGSNTVLKRMKKNITVEQNEQIISNLAEIGMNIGIDFILFDNKTTINELKENYDFFKRNGLIGYYPALIYNQMYPYPGTEYAEKDIDMNHYFENKDVEFVYKQIELFSTEIQPFIDKLLISQKLDTIDEIWLKTLPYFAFEKFLFHHYSFEQYEKENNIKEKIRIMEESV